MNLTELQHFIEQTKIPDSSNHFGFLEIIRKQSHENINSSIYAHFINSSSEEVQSLFLSTLLELIKQKANKKLELSNAFAQTEVGTGNGRIDILIQDFSSGHSIIIENKIYHTLENDLKDYWDFVIAEESSKVGVLLTLKPHEIPKGKNLEGKFINITHSEWIALVEEQFDPTSFDENNRVYISDFISTINNLSTAYKMNDSTRFYFQNAEQVRLANQTMNEAHNFINNQLQLLADRLGWSLYGNSPEWRNIWDSENKLETYLTVITKDLLEGKGTVMIIIELNKEDMKREDALRLEFSSHDQFKDKVRGEGKKWYQQMLCKPYNVSDNDLERLGDFLFDKIKEDFMDLMLKMIEHLHPEKDISKWKGNFIS